MTDDNVNLFVTKPGMPDINKYIGMLHEIWESANLTNNGKYVQELERALMVMFGGVGVRVVANGTLALMIAIKALGLKGKIVTTPYSFIATANSILWSGCEPVFCDIDPITFNISPESIEDAIDDQVVGIMPVHVYGQPCDVIGIKAVADKYGVPVIYDAAHSFGVTHQEKDLCSYGDISVLSFHATKVFTTVEGGGVVSRDNDLLKRVEQLRNFGITSEVSVETVGINAKMNELQAAFGLAQLDIIEDILSRRQSLIAYYKELLLLVDGVAVHDPTGVNTSGYMPIIVNEHCGATRDEMYACLKKYGVFSRRYFYPLIPEYAPYNYDDEYIKDTYPVSYAASRNILCLPLYDTMTKDNVDYIIAAIKSIA